jgi:hypothetical protein
MQLRVHLCFVCSPRHFVYQCCLLLTERRMNESITHFSAARHCTSTASQHAFQMHLSRGKKLSRTRRTRCGDADAHRVDSRRTARHAWALRSVAIHGCIGHLARLAPRTRCVSTRVRVGRVACALKLEGALTRAPLAARSPQFDCSWWGADCLRFGSGRMCAFVSSICARANVTETNARNSPAVPYAAVFSLERRVWSAREVMRWGRSGGLDGGSALRNHARLATVRDLDIITVAV